MKILRMVFGLMLGGMGVAGWGQLANPGLPQPPAFGDPLPPSTRQGVDRRTTVEPAAGSDKSGDVLAAQQLRTRNSERQKKLSSDSERLLALAAELQTEMGQVDSDVKAADVARKAEEIEKLAKSVKDRMRS